MNIKNAVVAVCFFLGACGGSVERREEPQVTVSVLPDGSFWCSKEHQMWCSVGETCLANGGCWHEDFYKVRCDAVACQALADHDKAYPTFCGGVCARLCQDYCANDAGAINLEENTLTDYGCPECKF